MTRINRLLTDPDFLAYLENTKECEADRVYCRHDLTHALDVARIAYVLCLEETAGLDKELVFAAALVHDLGRWMEYRDSIPHDAAGVHLAEGLLKKSGFGDHEIGAILEAIGRHRDGGGASALSGLLYRADKLSRNCVSCATIGTCKHFQNGEKPFLNY